MSEERKQYEGFLQSDDIGYGAGGGNEITVTIADFAEAGTVKDATGKVVDKPVVYFAKARKGLILNRTNERVLKLAFGKDPAKWVGNKATLTVRFVNAFGERDVPTVRVLPPEGVPLPFGVRKWKGKDKPSGGGL